MKERKGLRNYKQPRNLNNSLAKTKSQKSCDYHFKKQEPTIDNHLPKEIKSLTIVMAFLTVDSLVSINTRNNHISKYKIPTPTYITDNNMLAESKVSVCI